MSSSHDLRYKFIQWQGRPTNSRAPMQAFRHFDLIQEMQRLWIHHMANRRSYAEPLPDVAPTATMSAYNTAYAFEMLDTSGTYNPEFEFPWTMQKGFDTINARISIAVPGLIKPGLSVRLQTQPLVSAVAATSGEYSAVHMKGPPAMAHWAQGDTQWVIASAVCEIAPTLPADRRIALRIQAALDVIASDPVSLSFEYSPKIAAVTFEDRIARVGG